MRGITNTLALLLAVGYLASRAELPTVCSSGSRTIARESDWRRTAQGWEQCSAWNLPGKETGSRPRHFPVHPAMLAVLQLLTLLLALRLDRSTREPTGDIMPPCADAAAPNRRCPECT